MRNRFYAASQDKEGGIYLCTVDDSGRIETEAFRPAAGCAWLTAAEGRLYAVLREPFQQQSGIVSFDILPDGRLENMSAPVPTHGSIATYLLSHRGKLYCANYLSGTAVLLPDKVAAYSGNGPVKDRQACSHPHCIVPFPSGNALAVTDLGTDTIHICNDELDTLSETPLPAGSGPRHLVFSPDGRYAYCSLELSGEVAVLERHGDALIFLERKSVLPEGYGEGCSAAEIRLSENGKKLYVSNRGHGGVCVFNADGKELHREGFISCGEGQHIREFNLVGDWIICADEKGHTLSVFRRGSAIDEKPVSVSRLLRVWCILPI